MYVICLRRKTLLTCSNVKIFLNLRTRVIYFTAKIIIFLFLIFVIRKQKKLFPCAKNENSENTFFGKVFFNLFLVYFNDILLWTKNNVTTNFLALGFA